MDDLLDLIQCTNTPVMFAAAHGSILVRFGKEKPPVFTVTVCMIVNLIILHASLLFVLWSGMGEVVPARTSSTLHPPSPLIVL